MAGSKSPEKRRIKVLFGRSEIDAHDRAPKLVMKRFMEAGMEVVYIVYGMVEEIVDSAIQEDADVIGLSFYSGGQKYVIPTLMDLLKERGITNILVVIGGTIHPSEISEFRENGVNEIFPVGTPIEGIIDYIQAKVPVTT